MADQVQVTNTTATPTELFNRSFAMMNNEANMSGMEYEMDSIAQLVINFIGDVQAWNNGTLASGTLSSGTQNRLNDVNSFMAYSSINFVESDAHSPLEDWKVPYAVSLKSQVRGIQAWYFATKTRMFGN